jgi:hypothetical protein
MDEINIGDYVYGNDWCYGQVIDIGNKDARVEFETPGGGGSFWFDFNELTKAPSPKSDIMDDGVYMELFAVKDGVRYNAKILNMKDATLILTNGLVDGIEKLWEEKPNA